MITKDTFFSVALKAYDNPTCKTIIEFENDLSKFQTLSRLCKKDVNDDVSHQILNTSIMIFNVFDNEISVRLMFYKVKPENWDKLKTLLVFLGRMPEEILEFGLINSDIPLCEQMIKDLRVI